MATYINIPSSDIKVFPTSRRNDQVDRQARLNTEQNLVSIVNRLIDKDSFIIPNFNDIDNNSSLVFDTTTNSITPGSCNIHGYYFNITNNIYLKDGNNWILGTPEEGSIIYFKINVGAQGTEGTGNFVELLGEDSNDAYTGLEIIQTTQTPEQLQNTTTTASGNTQVTNISYRNYYLPIIIYKNGIWTSYPDNYVKFTGEKLSIDIRSDLTTDIKQDKTIPLQTFITNSLQNLIIDDGTL